MPFHVYILANRTRVLYVGVTANLCLRVTEHEDHVVPGFTQHYNVDLLVYFEEYSEPVVAIEREKRIKRMTRAKKIRLIEKANSEWRDLADALQRRRTATASARERSFGRQTLRAHPSG